MPRRLSSSAQCRSSATTTTGRSAVAFSTASTTASNTAKPRLPPSASRLPSDAPRGTSSRSVRASRIRPGRSCSISSAPPTSTSAPVAAARSCRARTRWVLPMPASPSRANARPLPSARPASSQSRAASSAARPKTGLAGTLPLPADTAKRRHWSGKPLSSLRPRSASRMPGMEPTSWRTTSETSTSPPAALAAMRAAALTASPTGSSGGPTTSPVFTPMRSRGWRPATAACTATANETARRGPGNNTMSASPNDLTCRPP